MNTVFYKLDEVKKKRIINAALRIFGNNSFKRASTDDIAALAQIGKGTLFLYFKNKRSLYFFLYEYALKELEEKAIHDFNFDERDYFQLIKHGNLIKMKLMKEYPYLYQFLLKANEETDPLISEYIADLNQKRQVQNYERFYAGVDTSRFKDEIKLSKLNEMITWCGEGIWKKGLTHEASIEDMYQEALEMIEFFRESVYKKEFLRGGS